MWFFPQNGVCAGYHAVVGLWRLLGWGGSYLSRFCAEGLEEAWQRACPWVLSLPVPLRAPLLLPSQGLRLRRWCSVEGDSEHAP